MNLKEVIDKLPFCYKPVKLSTLLRKKKLSFSWWTPYNIYIKVVKTFIRKL